MARILCLDSDTHFSGHPGGQAKFTEDFVEPLADEHDVEVVTVGSFEERSHESVTYRSLVRAEEVSRRTQMSFARSQVDVVRQEGHRFDLIIENFIPPIGPSGLPRFTSTPVIGLANFSFWDEMSAKYHLPFQRVTRRRLVRYQWIATTHESVARRIRGITPHTRVQSFGQLLSAERDLWNEVPGVHALYLGRPDVHQKGIDLLVRALHSLGDSAPPVSVGGFDASHPAWTKLTRRWPLPESVTVHGYVRGVEKERLLRAARLLLLPSRYEGPSYVPLEGAVHGVPTVAFDLECFEDRRGAMYLARPYSIEDFARQIMVGFGDEDLFAEKRRAAQALVVATRAQDPRRDFRALVNEVLGTR